MATETVVLNLAAIGETAGVVWGTLSEKGPMTIARLVKAADRPRDVVMAAIGWLAREDKLVVSEGRTRTIGLR